MKTTFAIFKMHKKASIYFILAFILFAIVGTITHEYGHILMAKSLGYQTTLHYGSMRSKKINNPLDKLYNTYESEIKKGVDFPEKKKFIQLQKKAKEESFLITLGGPLQTMATGLLGLFMLYYRKIVRKGTFQISDWFYVFLALFWLREVFNLLMGLVSGLFKNDGKYFGTYGDEVQLSKHLGIYDGIIPLLFGVLGLIVSVLVVFKIIPTTYRFTFIVSGFIGGITGFVLWFYYLGPMVLPLGYV